MAFCNHQKAHKLNFTWARYFMECCDLVRTGEVNLRHAFEILSNGNMIPGPEWNCPPTTKDYENYWSYQEDDMQSYEYYKGVYQQS